MQAVMKTQRQDGVKWNECVLVKSRSAFTQLLLFLYAMWQTERGERCTLHTQLYFKSPRACTSMHKRACPLLQVPLFNILFHFILFNCCIPFHFSSPLAHKHTHALLWRKMTPVKMMTTPIWHLLTFWGWRKEREKRRTGDGQMRGSGGWRGEARAPGLFFYSSQHHIVLGSMKKPLLLHVPVFGSTAEIFPFFLFVF